ncbi:hypothetical protein G6F57_001503 [Rhizopus arrhizus]|uniref:C2H2-type domain-containing protein n=1 Tax=Rhizopus oryzae TaxID=64495 RepID=A0A9P7BW40_RHIOR|nr:hypothetical protein G6F23_005548 [Rhizopus arrhizus]KAG1426567.1 hypothetical protein G6F58_001412 [Rhizopus delemar]KAG0765910.1 hypothetical protein G6F24_004034 [Rhizopus arrhizus]KAG0786213.1 hypothetical protein G6F21_008752 [Rhizopus arrhizus]KAG0789416.1 hypothetical protein G6F22_006715 [Rhizopus arrhizus]
MSSKKKQLVQLANTCYLCDDDYNFSTPSSLKKHLQNVHGVNVPSRKITDRRPVSKKYDYTLEQSDDVPVHHACFACFFHTSSLSHLGEHMKREHGVTGGRREDAYEEEEEEEGESMTTRSVRSEELKERSKNPSRGRDDHNSTSATAESLARDAMRILAERLGNLMK